MSGRPLTLKFCVILLAAAYTLDGAPDELYRGWLAMYDLNFQEAHQRISRWEAAHPENAMGPTSQATAYLFAELARLGALESELFVNNEKFRNRERHNPDPEAKRLFMEQLAKADDLAKRALAESSADADALLAESIALGLRADYDSLIEQKMLTPLKYTKESREYAERLLSAQPSSYDAYLAPGIENYILSLKVAPVRFLLRLKGAQVDHDRGIDGLALYFSRRQSQLFGESTCGLNERRCLRGSYMMLSILIWSGTVIEPVTFVRF